MTHRVCPWWLGYFLASPLRRIGQDPAKILTPYVREGMRVLEPGPGMGFFTVELARLVGKSGRVVVVDIQPRMLAGLKRRVSKNGLLDRLDARLAGPDSMGLEELNGTFDFALVFAVVHELPSATSFFTEAAAALRPGACLLLGEPRGHVNEVHFEAELTAAAQAGLDLVDRPSIRRTHAALLKKSLSC
jgi:SAM-dependent methyltransferase